MCALLGRGQRWFGGAGVVAEPVKKLAPVVGPRAVQSFSVARLPLLWPQHLTRHSRFNHSDWKVLRFSGWGPPVPRSPLLRA